MAAHNEVGKNGEDLAEQYLLKLGYSILHRNWRFSHYELDLITLKDGMPHFIEVKTRTSLKFGLPEECITRKKIQDLLRAINVFMHCNREFKNFRIDILAIIMQKGQEPLFTLIEDVYL